MDLRHDTVLAKAKSRTTHDDLSDGLTESIDAVLTDFGKNTFEPSLIGVSTTLATNCVLENQGGDVGLIGLGWKPNKGWELGAKIQRFLPGGHDSRGSPLANLDMEELERNVQEMIPRIDSLVISGLFSVQNPYQENSIKEAVQRKHDIPVVLGHELTAELGIYERTVTAVLNARLMPVLSDFLDKVLKILEERKLNAPVMILKGDGTLMNLRTARERPVDTVLSGPAASAMGGRVLSGVDDCLMIDMGGTSTDIAVLSCGVPKVSKEGSTIGKWKTRVEAVDMRTSALGGDSEVRLSFENGLSIGPQRVMPLCFATRQFPDLLSKMQEIGQARFIYLSEHCKEFSGSQGKLASYLNQHGPSTLSQIKNDLDIVLLLPLLDQMRARGAIASIGFTPTDALHARGIYAEGDVEASLQGADLFAQATSISREKFLDMVLDRVSSQMAEEVMRKMLIDNLGTLPDDPAFNDIIKMLSGEKASNLMRLNAALDIPVIGIGAPAMAYMTSLEKKIGARVIIPNDYEVGNAVGAVCGHISEYVDVFIYPRDKGFAVHSAFSAPILFLTEQDAIERAKELASEKAIERATRAGALYPAVRMTTNEERVPKPDAPGVTQLAELRIRARAVGKPIEI
ncbi:MAG: hydantoinase/oxoprolinase family protein [Euryarchaeota archaeon]|nr:hydantoinase/oxoprolinase family protein [Euryarchaeota archaeon]